mgnify:CR=1 FL=1
MKELGLIIDLNQPLVNEESVIKRSITDFYNPLAKLLKSYKNISFSLNIPLSTLELWEKHEASGLISEFRDMYQNEKIELINSSPYGLSLSGLPEKIIESQLILNEYGIGYYLGSRQGFEGEPSIMLKDVTGFLPVFNNIDEAVLKVLFDLDYSWFAIKKSNLNCRLFEIDDGERVIKGVNVVDDLDDIISGLALSENNYINSEGLDKYISEELDKVFKNIYNDNDNSAVVSLGLNTEKMGLDINYKNLYRVYESVLDSLVKMFEEVKNVGEILKFKGKLKKYTLAGYLDEMKNTDNEKETNLDYTTKICQKILDLNYNNDPISFNDINENDMSSIKLWNLEHIKTLNNTNILNNTCYLMIISKLVPLMNLKESKNYIENESYSDLVKEETQAYVDQLISYIDNTEVIEFLRTVN